MSNTTVIQSFTNEFNQVFKKELGVLKGTEATIELQPTAQPCFSKNQPVHFALKEKVETLLKAK